uniref:Putative sterigmatocystin biosynthesis P450 monooxygenase n=1 Tax=Talaromyces marneffei PM1 TaxID=1077442 RepID=A0A093V233_TALMA
MTMSSALETPELLTWDQRSDNEILADLQTYKPVDGTSERNIWSFWDKGLTAYGSPNHYSKYFSDPECFFPAALLQKTMKGTHVGPHAADLIRLPLLYLYGGVWLDVGFLLFRDLDDLCWCALADPFNPVELAGFKMTISQALAMFWNGLIGARKGSLVIKYWHDIFLNVWNNRTSCDGINSHPLLRHLPRYEVPSSTGLPPAFVYKNFVDYLAQMFCLERLQHLRDLNRDWDGLRFFESRVLLFECVSEVYWAQHITHLDGRKQFNMLSCVRAETEPEFLEAEKFIQEILSTSSTMKLSHGLVTEQGEYLARIWDEPENEDADCRPGTFAAYLRWASVYFQQMKKLTPVQLPVYADAIITGNFLQILGESHPIAELHSMIFGHLLLVNGIQYFPHELECPSIVYLDLWPVAPSLAIVNDPDLCAQAIQRIEFSTKSLAEQVHSSSGTNIKHHTFLRSRFAPAFRHQNVVRNIPIVIEEASIFTETLRTQAGSLGGQLGNVFSLEDKVSEFVFDTLANFTVGLRLNEQTNGHSALRLAIYRQTANLLPRNLFTLKRRMNPMYYLGIWKNNQAIARILVPIIRSRSHGASNMSIGMLNHHDKRTVLDIVAKTWLSHNQTKSEEEKDAFVDSMLQNVKIFMLAGHDTTTAAICYAFELLAYHPGEPEKLRAEHGSVFGKDRENLGDIIQNSPEKLNNLPFTLAVIKECLRLLL